jgi:hypothetical protein
MSEIDTQRLVREILGSSAVAIIEEEKALRAEIAALREAVRYYYNSLRYEGASDASLMLGVDEAAVRRALEEER